MYANIAVLIMVLFIAYWWGNQGFYSSLLHLVAVIVAGALSFALWEVISVDLLMKFAPTYAWGAGLLAPFLVILFVLRLGLDKLLKGNVYFSQIVNMVAGGTLGLASGILTAGVVLIGVEFLPVGSSVLGYQPWVMDANGRVTDVGASTLWFPVDRQTAGFFNYLSNGAFADSTPLALYQPDLAKQAGLYRMHFDPNASLVATPDSVKIVHYDVEATPLQHVEDSVRNSLGELAKAKSRLLVAVDTVWTKPPDDSSVYDKDSVIRVAPTQVYLVTVSRDEHDRSVRTYPAVAVGHLLAGGKQRLYIPVTDTLHFLASHEQDLKVSWIFMIPDSEKPVSLLARHLRIELPASPGSVDELRDIVGSLNPAATTGPAGTPGTTATPSGPTIGNVVGGTSNSMVIAAAATDKLPSPVSKNLASSFDFDGTSITKGRGVVGRSASQMDAQAVLADRVFSTKGSAIVRLQLERTAAQSLLGAARNLASDLGGVYLTDANSQPWKPVGYIIVKQDGTQDISIDVNRLIQSGSEIPVNQVQSGDALYLYFSVDKGSTIVSYHMGKAEQTLNLFVP